MKDIYFVHQTIFYSWPTVNGLVIYGTFLFLSGLDLLLFSFIQMAILMSLTSSRRWRENKLVLLHRYHQLLVFLASEFSLTHMSIYHALTIYVRIHLEVSYNHHLFFRIKFFSKKNNIRTVNIIIHQFRRNRAHYLVNGCSGVSLASFVTLNFQSTRLFALA